MSISDTKHFSKEITRRFIIAMDRIISNREGGKVTAQSFGKVVGVSGSNLTRLRNISGGNNVTMEALGRLCHHYQVSPNWLITGKGEMFYEHKEIDTRLETIESTVKSIDIAVNKIVNKIK